MKYEVVLTPESSQDLSEIFHWYENQTKGLGKDFLSQIEHTINILKENPEIYQIQYKSLRRSIIKNFPYKLFYTVEEDRVVILAIIFGGRDPNWIKKKLSQK